MLKDDTEEERQPQPSDSRIAQVVEAVLDRRETRSEQKKEFEAIKKDLEEARKRFCTPEGLCFKDQESLNRHMAKRKKREEVLKRAENERKISVPELRKLNDVARAEMSESEKIARRQKFEQVLNLSNSSVVDAYNMIRHNPQDYAVMRRRTIDSMTDDELQQAFLKCVGEECKVLRTNLVKRGYRVQKKDKKKDRWNPLDQEEQEERKSHF